MNLRALSGLVRPFTLLAPPIGVGSGVLIAASATGRAVSPTAVASAVAAALLATAASNAWNQAFDVEIDRVNKPGRPLPRGVVTVRGALFLGHVCALLGLGFAALASPAYLACLFGGLVATWIYSAPPLRTKRRPFAALLTIATARGLFVPVAGWAVVAAPDVPDPWFLGFVVGLFVLGAAATKDFADVAGDRAHDCHTLPVLYGSARAARMIAPFLVFPFLLYPVGALAGWVRPSFLVMAAFGVGLALLGALTAARLLRAPEGGNGNGGNHPTWAAMYLLMLAVHVGTALLYVATRRAG